MTHSHPFDRPTASPIVLASRSPSRRLALDVLRLDYEVDWSTPRTLLESEIRAYMDTHPVLHCAGAYEEDAALRFAERVEGNPNFRTALPVDRLMLFLREQGVDV